MTEATTSVRKKAGIQYKLFAKEYVLDLNGARAAIAAGDSEKERTHEFQAKGHTDATGHEEPFA
jgi:hypothetical protein